LKNFGTLLDSGDEPSCIMTYEGVEVEIRFNKLLGIFERKVIGISET
jgi:hypothetical protein